MHFNEQQQRAIKFKDGACAVIAGAGSGKTTVLVERIKNLVDNENVNESDILTISFTNNTAKELKNKLHKKGFENINVGTFHSICAKILTENGFDLSKEPKEWQIENWLTDYNDKKPNIKDIMDFIGYQKSYMRTYKDNFVSKDSKYSNEQLREFYKKYEMNRVKNKMYTYDDWLIECYKLLKGKNHKYTWKYVLVDEHQDSNLIQNLLIKEWCKLGNIFCIGDFRQSIYGFRGSVPEMFMDFDKQWDNATVINLDVNYRSSKDIVDKANSFIKKYYGNYRYYSDSTPSNKTKANINTYSYESREEEGQEVINKIDELLKNGESPNNIAILYRLNTHSDYVEGELKKRNIPYYISKNSSFFKRTEINAIMSYLRLIENPHDNVAFDNIFKLRNYPINYFSNNLFEDIKSFAGRRNLSLYEAFTLFNYDKNWQIKNVKIFEDNIEKLRLQKDKGIDISKLIDNIKLAFNIEDYIFNKYDDEEEQEDRLNSIETLKSFIRGDNLQSFINYAYSSMNNKKKINNDNCIKLMTIHASKGLEFKHVFIIGIEDGKFPHNKSELIDEARLFYVGITRPKESLYLSQIGTDNEFVNQYI